MFEFKYSPSYSARTFSFWTSFLSLGLWPWNRFSDLSRVFTLIFGHKDVKVQPEQQTSPWYAREAWLYLQTINYNFLIGIVFIWSEPSVSELLVDEICLPSLRIFLSRLRYLKVMCYRPKHQFTTEVTLINFQYLYKEKVIESYKSLSLKNFIG